MPDKSLKSRREVDATLERVEGHLIRLEKLVLADIRLMHAETADRLEGEENGGMRRRRPSDPYLSAEAQGDREH